MKVQISDLIVRTREVEIPDRCPECGVELTVAANPHVSTDTVVPVNLEWNFQADTYLPVTFPPEELPVPPTGYTCDCGHVLIWGKQGLVEAPSPELERMTLWSRDLNELIFNLKR